MAGRGKLGAASVRMHIMGGGPVKASSFQSYIHSCWRKGLAVLALGVNQLDSVQFPEGNETIIGAQSPTWDSNRGRQHGEQWNVHRLQKILQASKILATFLSLDKLLNFSEPVSHLYHEDYSYNFYLCVQKMFLKCSFCARPWAWVLTTQRTRQSHPSSQSCQPGCMENLWKANS